MGFLVDDDDNVEEHLQGCNRILMLLYLTGTEYDGQVVFRVIIVEQLRLFGGIHGRVRVREHIILHSQKGKCELQLPGIGCGFSSALQFQVSIARAYPAMPDTRTPLCFDI